MQRAKLAMVVHGWWWCGEAQVKRASNAGHNKVRSNVVGVGVSAALDSSGVKCGGAMAASASAAARSAESSPGRGGAEEPVGKESAGAAGAPTALFWLRGGNVEAALVPEVAAVVGGRMT